MASSQILRSRNNRQWMLSTALRFSGSDFNDVADSTNEVRFDVRPGTLFIRGTLYIITADSTGEGTVSIGVAGDLDKLDTNIDIFSAGAVPILAYSATAGGDPFEYKGTSTLWYPDYTTMYMTYDNIGAMTRDGEYLLQLEYIVLDRSNEVYG